MRRSNLQLRNLAQRLITHDAVEHPLTQTKMPRLSLPVCERLRPELASLMGYGGFRALVTRALALAKAELPSLGVFTVNSDGSLEGPEASPSELTSGDIFEGQVVLLAHLLGLLVTFIGEDLTLHLLGDVWPKLTPLELEIGNRDQK